MQEKPLIAFDYAIKYLLKNKSDYDIIEGFISALFASQGYKPVKINALLDTESNKEDKNLKRSIADLVVEDNDGNKYIVEIERSFTPNFIHKACFNSSRLVVDSISGSQDYTTIKKVFHISILYFTTQGMSKPICHGQTIVHEIDTEHPKDVRVANQGLVIFESKNIFPEYFFISVPRFNDVINQEIDEWLYVMKHSDTRQDFKSAYMAKVKERLSVLKMSKEDRDEYIYYMKEAVHSQDVLTAAEQKGEARGLEKGREEGEARGIERGKAEGEARGLEKGKIETAINMLNGDIDEALICKFTGLSAEELAELKKQHKL
jgi:predicted transposase/invertase (TIGR01784 family)